ncbi:YusW family protein [Oceanobacillus alkalisoli]|uniref:YusW family protein n=1 Tax=Oceanobacillus alkalisoli TaxID=2925113 RepID=UPI001EF03018|nr:YusW family protein [Oceanobacillus alkalisoli]MCF3941963.1 YusW family protein [Oceanobacillus alkalisoli]MCG5102084.1 YusW family protein [Oceanobacillus alkalisoli]
MKKLFSLLTILLLSTILAACGDNDEVTNPPQDDTTTENPDNGAADDNTNEDNQTDNNNEANGDSDNADFTSDYIFTSFDLEVDIENNDDAVDVDYDVDDDDNEIEASYVNKPDNINLRGNEAMDELDSIFTSFEFDENTPDEEVINEVLQAFNIPEDAAKVDLEIEFGDNVEKEYRR